MDEQQSARQKLMKELGYKPLNRLWAKTEILLGLVAVFAGLMLGSWSASQAAADRLGLVAIMAAILFVLGAYLAMAGHRSHLYQSQNELIAYLAERIESFKDKG